MQCKKAHQREETEAHGATSRTERKTEEAVDDTNMYLHRIVDVIHR